ncbi:MAG: hypothetical protein IKR48_12755 [Kiritimatiellae bacterium]|nr:hypothetical protein [Kiritimatiellia bacterium]
MNNKVMYWMTALIAGIFCLTAVPADAKPAGGPGGGGKPPAVAKPGPAAKPPAAKPPASGKKVYPVPGAHGGHHAPAPAHRPPEPAHHHKDKHHHHSGSAFAGGLIGGFLGALIEPAPPPRPAPHYEDRQERIWVEGQWVYGTDSWGRRTQVWEPGHWEVRTVRVWVE